MFPRRCLGPGCSRDTAFPPGVRGPGERVAVGVLTPPGREGSWFSTARRVFAAIALRLHRRRFLLPSCPPTVAPSPSAEARAPAQSLALPGGERLAKLPRAGAQPEFRLVSPTQSLVFQHLADTTAHTGREVIRSLARPWLPQAPRRHVLCGPQGLGAVAGGGNAKGGPNPPGADGLVRGRHK